METADCPFVCISMQLSGPSILNNTKYVHAFNPSYAHLQGQVTNLSFKISISEPQNSNGSVCLLEL
jgi:hypothetical protein